MNKIKNVSRIILGVFYIVAGALHFIMPEFYLKIMPPYVPYHELMVYLSGIAEIVLGVMVLVPAATRYGAFGIVLLLVAVFPANLYHFTSSGADMDIPNWALALRLPLQLVLIAWAFWHTRSDARQSNGH